jgi:hypothetical protein
MVVVYRLEVILIYLSENETFRPIFIKNNREFSALIKYITCYFGILPWSLSSLPNQQKTNTLIV